YSSRRAASGIGLRVAATGSGDSFSRRPGRTFWPNGGANYRTSESRCERQADRTDWHHPLPNPSLQRCIAAGDPVVTGGLEVGARLEHEYRLSPVPHQIAVEEFEHDPFLRGRVSAGDDSGDDHVATVVESERQHRFR